jgi:hypothetical protein
MKGIGILCALACALSTAAFAQVSINVQEPVTNGTYTTPILIAGSASSTNGAITGWAAYFTSSTNGTQEYYNNPSVGPVLDQTLSNVPAGTYTQVTITVWDHTGASQSQIIDNVTVVPTPMPTPPSNALEHSNVQAGSWTQCDGPTCSGSASGSSCSIESPIPPGPMLSANTLGESITGTYCNVLKYQYVSCPTSNGVSNDCDAVQNMVLDEWFQPASLTDTQQLEFDPDIYDSQTYKYFGSIACRLLGSTTPADQVPGYWYLWNATGIAPTSSNPAGDPTATGGTGAWVKTSYPCNSSPDDVTAGAWHHIQLYVTFNTSDHTYTYQTFVFDGHTVFQGLGAYYYALKLGTATEDANVEQQIDNGPDDPTTTVYYDNQNLWIW